MYVQLCTDEHVIYIDALRIQHNKGAEPVDLSVTTGLGGRTIHIPHVQTHIRHSPPEAPEPQPQSPNREALSI